MRILFINETCGTGSHGKICVNLARQYEKEGHQCRIAYGRSSFVPETAKELAVHIGSPLNVFWHGVISRLFDGHGFSSQIATRKFLKWMDTFQPEMIWLHNLHGYYIHVGMLFKWIKKHPEIQIKWTLHDCWSFTGHCAHYMALGCTKWQEQCCQCPGLRQYPVSLCYDNSSNNFKKKKELFTGIPNMKLITPSLWLMNEVKKSFLKDYPAMVVNNEIDKNVFFFRNNRTEIRKIREKYGIHEHKQVILGVASVWTERKGYNDFVSLSSILDSKRQQLVLVGINENQQRILPPEIVGIKRTENVEELAYLYSIADVFLNLTYEENYPTVNLEAEACETDVLTYDAGGCKETVSREGSKIFSVGDLDGIASELFKRIGEE